MRVNLIIFLPLFFALSGCQGKVVLCKDETVEKLDAARASVVNFPNIDLTELKNRCQNFLKKNPQGCELKIGGKVQKVDYATDTEMRAFCFPNGRCQDSTVELMNPHLEAIVNEADAAMKKQLCTEFVKRNPYGCVMQFDGPQVGVYHHHKDWPKHCSQ